MENIGSLIRPWLFAPRPRFRDLAGLNAWLLMRCQTPGERRDPIFKDRTIDEVYRKDLTLRRSTAALRTTVSDLLF